MRVFAVLAALLLLSGAAFGQALNFASTQMNPAAEQAFAKGTLLKGFADQMGVATEFIPVLESDLLARLAAETAARRITISVVGALHGTFDVMKAKGYLSDASAIQLPARTFIKSLADYSVIGGKKAYVPWMQATYVMAINKKAFAQLPSGLTEADVTRATDKWTYDALLEWSKNLQTSMRGPKLGFPMSPNGLWHRFLHGYIYPSFTGSQAKGFDSDGGMAMWSYLRNLMPYIHPASSTWSNMDEPLLREEVLIAWDHTARLKPAVVQKPADFALVPVPRGPRGRGYITVAAGLAIPEGAPQRDNAVKLIDYLTRPPTQVTVLDNIGFFPTAREAEGAVPAGPLKILAGAVLAQSAATDSSMVLIPGMGTKGGDFNNVYRDTFTKVVVEKADVSRTVKDAATRLRALFQEVGVPLE